jgi:AcrR family transcriptional regulator
MSGRRARRPSGLRAEAIIAEMAGAPAEPDEATEGLLDATSQLLAAHGLRRWSMEDVADQAGLGRATLYRRFSSRDDLVHAALGREVRRFFTAIAEAVAGVDTVEDQVVAGFLAGWRLVRGSALGELVATDGAAALSLLGAAPVLAFARAALVERYRILTGTALTSREAAHVELVAEALVRLGLSFVLIPDSVIDLNDPHSAQPALRRLLEPLLSWPQSGP